ncbi:MAG: YkgJ family cysteine cluster protein [Planctomycetales bacterium]
MTTTVEPFGKPRIQREDLPAGESLCEYCTAKCCNYIALPIETPDEWSEYEFIRWYILHKGATIFLDDGTWYLCVRTVCEHLLPDHRCGIYETRPQICRDYTTDGCEYEGDGVYDQYFELGDQLYEYAEAVLGPPKGGSFRSPEPNPLPIVS